MFSTSTYQLVGLAPISPLAITDALNNLKPENGNVLTTGFPMMATHLNVWYYKSLCRGLSQYVAAFPSCEKGYTRQYDFAMQFVDVSSRLAVWNIPTRYHTSDCHKNNVVCGEACL